jgi:riboflavin synthase
VFTGLVAGLGIAERIVHGGSGRRLTIRWPNLALSDPLKLGESIAISGCCLTVIAASGEVFDVQAGPETLACTTLGDRKAGDWVNLERSLSVGDRLGGHFVQGHVDTTAVLHERRPEGEWEFLAFAIESRWAGFMVSKGSVAIDGVSLTLVDVDHDRFSVMLIPHTRAVTTLGTIAVGERVNIEVDILAKYVQKLACNGRSAPP